MKKTSKEWQKLLTDPLGIQIMDPDGWDRRNWKYSYEEEEITAEEFRSRVGSSTCMFSIDSFKQLDIAIKEYQ